MSDTNQIFMPNLLDIYYVKRFLFLLESDCSLIVRFFTIGTLAVHNAILLYFWQGTEGQNFPIFISARLVGIINKLLKVCFNCLAKFRHFKIINSTNISLSTAFAFWIFIVGSFFTYIDQMIKNASVLYRWSN